jgi:Mg2+/Co2+ transporter CorC/osmotically-inducible protein OsmY/sporulation protein YlmC with PRC-barrel domain
MDLGGLYRALASLSPPRDRGCLQVLLHAAVRTGALPRELADYVTSALDVSQLQVRNAMVPRVDVVAVPDDCPAAEAARQMAEHGRKRLPVYQESIDWPVGVVHAIDVARALATHADDQPLPTAGQLARATPAVPETLPLLDAMRTMRLHAAHLLLVVDQRGGFAGLTTLEDIVEQLLGPIPDEYGTPDRHAIRLRGDGVAVVGGAVPLHEVGRVLDVRLPPSRYVSIGGLVVERLGRLPRPGDVVQLPGMRIEVLSVEGTRIRELRVHTGPSVSRDGRLIEVGLGKDVVCGTEAVGRVEQLVAEPKTGRVRHFVVRSRGRAFVLPLEVVDRTDEGVVYLARSGCDLQRFPTYEPAAISERTEVVCGDGPVGRVQQVLLDPSSGVATHIVVRLTTGLLTPREVVVPLTWARSISSSRIELSALRAELLDLPEYRPDDEIAADILRRLAEDPQFQGLDRYTLKAKVQAGVVWLTGRVRTAEHKLAAEQLASTTPGVLSVRDELIADDEVAANIERALQNAGLPLTDLEVAVLLGQVKLRGRVATRPDREAAERVARSVPGVESIVNDLVVGDD